MFLEILEMRILSCHFRYALLYDPVISSLAKQAMKSHPRELIEAAHAKVEFTILCFVETFQNDPDLLDCS